MELLILGLSLPASLISTLVFPLIDLNMLHLREFYEAIARGIDAENEKASVYISHAASLGTAREIILRDVLRDSTPEPYRMGTGLIHGSIQGAPESSRQCDVLVYDPWINPPKYSFENFVVLDEFTPKLNIEVKSVLNLEAFTQAHDVSKSTWRFSQPTLAFAYESVQFKTLVNYYSDTISEADAQLPWCLAVHTNNFLGIIPRTTSLDHEKYALLIDCGRAEETHHGMATSVFLQLYDAWLRDRKILSSENLYQWYNSLTDIPDDLRAYISQDGTVTNGPIPSL